MNKRMINKLNKTKLSDLILMSVEDMRAIQRAGKAKGVVLDMGEWVSQFDGKCEVCMAGAVMFRRCDVQDAAEDEIPDFAIALNYARSGMIRDALRYLGESECPVTVLEKIRDVLNADRYDSRQNRFKFSTYKKMAAVLKEYGL